MLSCRLGFGVGSQREGCWLAASIGGITAVALVPLGDTLLSAALRIELALARGVAFEQVLLDPAVRGSSAAGISATDSIASAASGARSAGRRREDEDASTISAAAASASRR